MKFTAFSAILAFAFSLTNNQNKVSAAENIWADAVRTPLKNSEAKEVGEVKLRQTPQGVLIQLRLSHFTPGSHAFHIHEVGKCDPPTFTSAGGHFNPSGKKHGMLNQNGQHVGDLPNIHVPESGDLTLEILAAQASLEEGDKQLLDENGSALVIHAGTDDYHTDPAGDAGERIACGVIGRPMQK